MHTPTISILNHRYLARPPPPTAECPPAARQLWVSAGATQTTFGLEVAGKVRVNLTFLSTMFTDDMTRLSRPVYYLTHTVESADGSSHAVEIYTDASAEHAVNTADEQVAWNEWNSSGLSGVRVGTVAQNVLGMKGDRVNINWGFLYLAHASTADNSGSVWAGSASQSRTTFATSGALPTTADARQPRAVSDDLPALSAAANLGTVNAAVEHVTLLAYDDVESV